MFRNLRPGQGWAYAGLLLGLAVSVTGNVTNTVMTGGSTTGGTEVPIWLRVPMAVVWPLFTWLGIEILTRTQWREHWSHWFVRAVMVGPVAGVAAFVSYLHLHHLMVMSREPGPAQAVGPIAIDTMLLGCTVVLIVTRQIPVAQVPPGVKVVTPEVIAELIRDSDTVAESVPDIEVPMRVPTPRGPRSTGWDVGKAIHMILEGEARDLEISEVVGVGPKMVQRTRRAVSLLKSDPDATVPAGWKVPAGVVSMIRTEVRR